jgi:predicted ATP-dependent endonuclease of OLD family
MNEQLIVKNFGPIKDATVDFKKVTVFIGPTGGGKSTLAKLAAIFRDSAFHSTTNNDFTLFKNYNIFSFINQNTNISWNKEGDDISIEDQTIYIGESLITKAKEVINNTNDKDFFSKVFLKYLQENYERDKDEFKEIYDKQDKEGIKKLYAKSIISDIFSKTITKSKPEYIPAERVFIASLEYSWAGLMRDDIGLPKRVLDFANRFSLSRKEIPELEIPFLNVTYLHIDGRDFIRIPDREDPLILPEAASGIQSATPLLVLLEHLSRNTERAQSFIIEEPELNLYPTAQHALVNWLVDKSTQADNDLTITTHSPYILASCNLLMEAYKVHQQRPELEAEIDKIVPRASWINPDNFAAYYVDKEVRSIKDERTDLIGGNDLDAVSGSISDAFRSLLRLKKQPA